MTATESRLHEVTFDGNDDYISDDGLDAVARAYDRLPDSWEMTSVTAHINSVTATIRFSCEGSAAQAQALRDVEALARCARPLRDNLVAARAALGASGTGGAE